ncbi:hypothetical protein QIH30_27710, partial [Klebsiella pneumoniae]|nr:hypothetical protein [Klebsiella pneumoniae]
MVMSPDCCISVLDQAVFRLPACVQISVAIRHLEVSVETRANAKIASDNRSHISDYLGDPSLRAAG